MCCDHTQNDLRRAIHMPFDEHRLQETYHVPCEARTTHFVQCAPDVIFNFKPPLEPFS